MTFVELLERGGLPLGVNQAMCDAADRANRGERLGPAARRSLRRLFRKLEQERADRANENWSAHDKQLREDGARTGSSPSRMARATRASSTSSPARPSAAPPAPRQPTTAGYVEPPVVGGAIRKSSFDGRSCSPQDLTARLAQLGLDASWYQVDQATEDARRTRQSPSMGLLVKQRKLESEAAARIADREKAIASTVIDARNAPAKEVAKRYADLGLDPMLAGSLRDPGKELPPLQPVDPFAANVEARRKAAAAAKRAYAQAARGRPPDTRRMDDLTFAEYLKIKRFAGGW